MNYYHKLKQNNPLFQEMLKYQHKDKFIRRVVNRTRFAMPSADQFKRAEDNIRLIKEREYRTRPHRKTFAAKVTRVFHKKRNKAYTLSYMLECSDGLHYVGTVPKHLESTVKAGMTIQTTATLTGVKYSSYLQIIERPTQTKILRSPELSDKLSV